MAQGFGESLERLATQTGVVDATLDFKVSSGLTRPDFFDWPKRLSSQVAKLQPDVVVICFGGNDAQPIKAQNGKTYQVSDPEWKAEYERRGGRGHGLPRSRRPQGHLGRHAQRPLRRLQRPSAGAVGGGEGPSGQSSGVSLVDTWDMFSSPDGAYADYVVDETDNQAKLIRADDGYHLNFDGANKLARAIDVVVNDEIKARGGSIGEAACYGVSSGGRYSTPRSPRRTSIDAIHPPSTPKCSSSRRLEPSARVSSASS